MVTKLRRTVFLCISLSLGLVVAAAEVRLLTGDSNNGLYAYDVDFGTGPRIQDISYDGSLILFSSGPPTTGSAAGITREGLYLKDLLNDGLTFVGVPIGGESNNNPTKENRASMSDDGRFITWDSEEEDFITRIYWRDTQSGETRAVTPTADGDCLKPLISGDGRYVVFASFAHNLIVDNTLPTLGNLQHSLYRYDSQEQVIDIVSLTHDGKAIDDGIHAGTNFDLSSDGQYIVFQTAASNVHPDRSSVVVPSYFWVYRRHLASGTVEIVNRNADGNLTSGDFWDPKISADGNRVLFAGGSIGLNPNTPLVPGFNDWRATELYIKDMGSQTAVRVSQTTNGFRQDGVFDSYSMNANGMVVAFAGDGSTYVSGDTDPANSYDSGSLDVFRADIASDNSVSVSHISAAPTIAGNVVALSPPLLPGTGRYVAFNTGQLENMLGQGGNDNGMKHWVGVGDFNFGIDPFELWSSTLPEADRGFDANPARDGLSNLVKFTFGIQPLDTHRNNLPIPGYARGEELGLTGDNQEYMTLTVKIRDDLPGGYNWIVRAAPEINQLSSDLGSAVMVGSAVPEGDLLVYTYRSTFTLSARGFMDVLLTSP
jgi:Tol biopolymer transport system component